MIKDDDKSQRVIESVAFALLSSVDFEDWPGIRLAQAQGHPRP